MKKNKNKEMEVISYDVSEDTEDKKALKEVNDTSVVNGSESIDKPQKKSKSRVAKNIVMIIVVLGLILGILLTSGVMQSFGKNNADFGGGQPPQMSDESGDTQTPPEKPDEDGEQATMEKPDGDDGQASMEKSDDSSNQTPPEKPDGDDNQADSEMGDMPQDGNMPENGNMSQSMSAGKLSPIKIGLVGVESLLLAIMLMYLILSGFNAKTLEETFASGKKIIAFGVSVIVLATGITVGTTVLPMKLMSKNAPQIEMQDKGNADNSSQEQSKDDADKNASSEDADNSKADSVDNANSNDSNADSESSEN